VEVQHEYNVAVQNESPSEQFDAIILAVAHNELKDLDLSGLIKEKSVVYDVKGCLDRSLIDGRL
jgi:UDP-N-acetyl-D-mannosaminuronate dehydrogenase